MKLKIGWKVFHRTFDGSLVSVKQRLEEGGIIYPIGKIINPKKGCGPITVFKKISNAAGFAEAMKNNFGPVTIRKIFYRPSTTKKVWYILNAWVSLETLIENNHNYGVTADATDLASMVCVLDEKVEV